MRIKFSWGFSPSPFRQFALSLYILFIILMCLQNPVLAQSSTTAIRSLFNNLIVNTDTTLNSYSFIVTGHLHGASYSQSGFPAATLLANIDSINNTGALFFVSLGDLFLELNEENIANYRKSLFNKLHTPFFNVVGNHDVRPELYTKHFGKTYFHFFYQNDLFIFLDTEKDDGSITGNQFDFFQEAIASGSNADIIQNIFIFSHRPVWAENNQRYSSLFAYNTRTMIGKNNFEADIRPILTELSIKKKIFWCSGSLGASPAPFFYDLDETGMIFINTGIRDLPRDGILLVSSKEGNISFRTISLTGKNLEPIETFNIEYWKSFIGHDEEKFNYRLIPYLVKQALAHRYFWYGFFTCLGILFALFLIIMVFLKKRS